MPYPFLLPTYKKEKSHEGDKVKFTFRGETLVGIVTRKNKSRLSIQGDKAKYYVPYHQVERVS